MKKGKKPTKKERIKMLDAKVSDLYAHVQHLEGLMNFLVGDYNERHPTEIPLDRRVEEQNEANQVKS